MRTVQKQVKNALNLPKPTKTGEKRVKSNKTYQNLCKTRVKHTLNLTKVNIAAAW